jgi:hypothetical protein
VTRETSTTPQRDTGAIAQPAPEDVHQVPITLDPAAELVGCLLQSTRDQAAEVLAFVADDDTTDACASQALSLIRDLIGRGLSTNPAAVLAHARTIGLAAREDAQKRLAIYLVDCYQAAAGPGNAWFVAAAVVETAYRRAGLEYAQAITQAAEERGLAEYEQVLGDRDRLRDLWRRHRIATGEPAAAATEIGGAA